jgi:hypothetical protein
VFENISQQIGRGLLAFSGLAAAFMFELPFGPWLACAMIGMAFAFPNSPRRVKA